MRAFILLSLVLVLTGMGGRRPVLTELGNMGGSSSEVLSSLPHQFNCQPTTDVKVCMMCNCYHEARGEDLAGQVAVARTVYTRTMSSEYPNTICEVVYQKAQFSWTLENAKKSQVLGPGASGMDTYGYNKCLQSVTESLPYRNTWFASHYHTTSIRPYWMSSCRGRTQVGSHYFYSGCGGVYPENNRSSESATGIAWIWDWVDIAQAAENNGATKINQVSKSASPNATSTSYKNSIEQNLSLEPEIKAILKKNPKLKMKTQFSKKVKNLFADLGEQPAFSHGDFNGDGEKEIAILVAVSGQDLACVFSKKQNYAFDKKSCLKVLHSENLYLSKVENKYVATLGTSVNAPAAAAAAASPTPRNDLLQVENYLGATFAYYVAADGKLKEFKGSLKSN